MEHQFDIPSDKFIQFLMDEKFIVESDNDNSVTYSRGASKVILVKGQKLNFISEIGSFKFDNTPTAFFTQAGLSLQKFEQNY